MSHAQRDPESASRRVAGKETEGPKFGGREIAGKSVNVSFLAS